MLRTGWHIVRDQTRGPRLHRAVWVTAAGRGLVLALLLSACSGDKFQAAEPVEEVDGLFPADAAASDQQTEPTAEASNLSPAESEPAPGAGSNEAPAEAVEAEVPVEAPSAGEPSSDGQQTPAAQAEPEVSPAAEPIAGEVDMGADSEADADLGDTSGEADPAMLDAGLEGGVGNVEPDSEPDDEPSEQGLPLCQTLVGTVRDFRDSHPDMEICEQPQKACESDPGIVEFALGEDGKPVYAGSEEQGTLSTSGQESFEQWFRDVEQVNTSVSYSLQLERDGGAVETGGPTFVFDSANPPPGSPAGFTGDPAGFFPIDDLQQDGFRRQQGYAHNYHFTYEIVGEFEYSGGDFFEVTGDDDIWVFINEHLVIDLGGVHLPEHAHVELDDLAEELGLKTGQLYPFHFFFAERHEEQSNLFIRTSLAFTYCGE